MTTDPATYGNGATFQDYEKARHLVYDGVDSIAAALAAERRSEDALLASVMRKLLAADGYANWGRRSNGSYWTTIDVSQVDLTAEEMQAIDDAAPAS